MALNATSVDISEPTVYVDEESKPKKRKTKVSTKKVKKEEVEENDNEGESYQYSPSMITLDDSEVLKYHSRQGPHIKCIYLYDIPGLFSYILHGLSHRIRALSMSLSGRDVVRYWLPQHTPILKPLKYPSYHRSGAGKPLSV